MANFDVSVLAGETINSNHAQGRVILIRYCDDDMATSGLDPFAVAGPEISFVK